MMRAAFIAAALLSSSSVSVSADDVANDAAISDPTELTFNDFSDSALMGDGELAASRGGQTKTVLNVSSVSGTVEGNSVEGGTTGSNLISNGAFEGATGFATVIQNSGNNVLIQDSTVVNVTVCGGTC